MDYITISSEGNEKIAELLSKNSNTITADVLCKEITTGAIDGYSKEWNINGENVKIGVVKCN